MWYDASGTRTDPREGEASDTMSDNVRQFNHKLYELRNRPYMDVWSSSAELNLSSMKSSFALNYKRRPNELGRLKDTNIHDRLKK